MELTNDQFNQFMIDLKFKKNETFKSDPKCQDRVIDYIKNMPINEASFEIVEYLIKEYGVSILLCFQPFYKKIIKNVEAQTKFAINLQRLSALALFVVKPDNSGQLQFFSVAGTAKKGFKIKDKTPEELEFMKDLEFIRKCIIQKKQNPKMQSLQKQKLDRLKEINEKVSMKKNNKFMSYYLEKMINKLDAEFKFEKIQGSTAEEEPHEFEFKTQVTQITSIDSSLPSALQKDQPTQQKNKQITSHFANQGNTVQKNNQNKKITETVQLQTLSKESQNSTHEDKKSNPSTKASTNATSTSSYDEPPKSIEIPEVMKTYEEVKQQKLEMQKKQKATIEGVKQIKSTSSKNQELQKTRDATHNSSNFTSTGIGLNFALIPLCCRTYFFDQERILPGEDKSTQYKSYKFPFSPASIETFKKTICAFLNTIGGEIYIGIKETTNKKYRYVLGNYLTENEKEEVLKSFRKITEAIRPNMTQNFGVEFVPVRVSPFQNISLLNQVETYYYDFSKKELKLENCPYKPARYVIRVRVPMGVREEMYSYIETECQLNKHATSNEFIPFRSQNEVLVKEISQEVLKRFKEKLIYGQEKDVKSHPGPCDKPEIGNPRNQAEPRQEIIDPKLIEASLFTEKRKPNPFEKIEAIEQEPNDDQVTDQSVISERKTQKSSGNDTAYSQEELNRILKYPLGFIVLKMSRDRLRKCIDKTPAKDYTSISLQKNELTGQDLLLIRVDTYSHMQQFLRVKAKIESHFQKEKVAFVGISKTIRLQSMENRRIAEQLLSKYNHKHAFNNRNLQFYSLTVSASYFLYMTELGYRMEVVPD